MNFGSLITSLPEKTAAIYTLERGKAVRHPYAALASEVARVHEDLSRWGIKAGDRVGIYAPNSRRWLVYDLALIALGAVSVPFTDDFAGKIDEALLERYTSFAAADVQKQRQILSAPRPPMSPSSTRRTTRWPPSRARHPPMPMSPIS